MMHHSDSTSPHATTVDLSLVVPVYNEAEGLGAFFQRLRASLALIPLSYEIICVNDGSCDATLPILLSFKDSIPGFIIIDLSRRFGKEIALSAGIDFARGRAVIPIDADLQDPPEVIEDLVTKWQEGYDVVYAIRSERAGESLSKRLTAALFYRIINRLSETPIPRNAGDFRLMDRRVVEALKGLPERNRFMKGLFSWVGFKQTGVYFKRDPRYAGRSKWNYWRLWNFALSGIVSSSSLPLRIWTYFGFTIASFSFLYGLYLIVRTILYGVDVPGYASLMTVILFLGGLQMIGNGIIGEYLSRVFDEVKGRPLYIIRNTYSYEEKRREA
jgi:polyisoprenyl-phosphate glycosyltransferase